MVDRFDGGAKAQIGAQLHALLPAAVERVPHPNYARLLREHSLNVVGDAECGPAFVDLSGSEVLTVLLKLKQVRVVAWLHVQETAILEHLRPCSGLQLSEDLRCFLLHARVPRLIVQVPPDAPMAHSP